MNDLKLGEGKSGRIIFDEERDKLKAPTEKVNNLKNLDDRSVFLEKCYNSNVREWEVIFMDILLRQRIKSI